MTGILPIKQYNTESALNNFEEFSMVSPGPLAGYFGFTQEEVNTLCRKFDMDNQLIKQWYDGYQLGAAKDIYNPFAVMRAMQRHSIESYWTATTTYETLKDYITMLRDAIDPSLLLGFGEIPYGDKQVMHLEADISALHRDTGFEPETDFRIGIQRTITYQQEKLIR